MHGVYKGTKSVGQEQSVRQQSKIMEFDRGAFKF